MISYIRSFFGTFVFACLIFFSPGEAIARDFGLGVHLLSPDELHFVIPYRGDADKFYITVPYHLSDRRRVNWEDFFAKSQENSITPILRLSTDFHVDKGVWKIPSKREIIDAVDFLSSLHWPGNRIVVLFNEPNHAKEWGGRVDPEEYADLAMFAASWLHTESVPYLVLPAGLDAAAPNSDVTMDSFTFWERVFNRQPNLVNWINGWASHSYPNPGFESPPYALGKNSLRGFEHELEFLRKFSKQDLPVYITETGWRQTRGVLPYLTPYYKYAFQHIWSHPQVKAVTVFLFQGFPGPFAEFSLLNPSGLPTGQMNAFGVVNQMLSDEK